MLVLDLVTTFLILKHGNNYSNSYKRIIEANSEDFSYFFRDPANKICTKSGYTDIVFNE